jgi:hypothetical protein
MDEKRPPEKIKFFSTGSRRLEVNLSPGALVEDAGE